MSKIYEVPAELREDVGKGASRRLRRANKVPAVVYGGERPPANLTLEHDFILHASEDEAFHSSVLQLKVQDGRTQKVIVRDIQRHPFKPRILHVDFQRVMADQKVRISVPLHFVNEERSPAGKMAGVVVSHQMTEVEIEALPGNLPEFIEVDLAKLEPGERVMLSEIPLPGGVEVPELQHGDEIVVSAVYVREDQGTGAAAAEADAALEAGVEPELVDEESDEEDGEGEGGEDAEAKE